MNTHEHNNKHEINTLENETTLCCSVNTNDKHSKDDKNDQSCASCAHNHDAYYDPSLLPSSSFSAPGRAVYRILNMDCPMEEDLIRDKLKNIKNIKSLDFNLLQRILTIHHELDSLAEVEASLNSIDMKPQLITENQEVEKLKNSIPWFRLGAALLLALSAEVAHFWQAPEVFVLIPALSAILIAGLSTYKKGWIALKNFNLNMNALMSIAVTGAALIAQWPEAAMVMVLFNLAEAIEAKSLGRAREAIAGLIDLTPEKATIKSENNSWLEVEAASVPLASIVRVRPGERIALDGIIINGASAINQAPITGESMPVEKKIGDQVFAGTINESGSFEFEVKSLFNNSTLARIIRSVEEAQSKKAPTQRFVDRFAKVYTPIVFILAILVAVIPPLLGYGTWFEWIYKALVLLVIACPCALVISTPVTIVSALAAATRHGLLIKGGVFLEEGRKINYFLLDKTGTISTGRPVQNDVLLIDDKIENAHLAAVSLAMRSDHPVSKAISEAASEEDKKMALNIDEFKAWPGLGTSGLINGEKWRLGNLKFLENQEMSSDSLRQKITSLEAQAKSVVAIWNDKGVSRLYAVSDKVKDSSKKAISELKSLGIKTIMLTGDNQQAADIIAQEVLIDEARGGLLPEEKLAVVKELSSEKNIIAMVGDGINDAPALAASDIGFAMAAAGAGAAIETADVALMDDDLLKLPLFIKLSRATKRVLLQNISMALGIKAIFLLLALMGHASMWMAVFADIGVSLMVVFNGLRMLKY